MIYRLSPVLGGRSEVLKAKFIELLKYMELENEKEEAQATKKEVERWLSFMSMLYAQPMTDSKDRKKFMDSIKPKIESHSQEIQQYETDVELLKRLKAAQKGG